MPLLVEQLNCWYFNLGNGIWKRRIMTEHEQHRLLFNLLEPTADDREQHMWSQSTRPACSACFSLLFCALLCFSLLFSAFLCFTLLQHLLCSAACSALLCLDLPTLLALWSTLLCFSSCSSLLLPIKLLLLFPLYCSSITWLNCIVTTNKLQCSSTCASAQSQCSISIKWWIIVRCYPAEKKADLNLPYRWRSSQLLS